MHAKWEKGRNIIVQLDDETDRHNGVEIVIGEENKFKPFMRD